MCLYEKGSEGVVGNEITPSGIMVTQGVGVRCDYCKPPEPGGDGGL